LYDTKVIFDRDPTKDKLDRAVNVRLWDGMDTPPPVDNGDNNNNTITPSPRKKRRTTSPFPWFEDELLIDCEKTLEELQEEHLYEHYLYEHLYELEEVELEGLVDLHYSSEESFVYQVIDVLPVMTDGRRRWNSFGRTGGCRKKVAPRRG
jgi:hypothetical protein